MWLASLSAFRSPLNLRNSQTAIVQFVRNVYKKKREYRGVFITDGMECHKGDVLVRTWRLNYYPGLNVGYYKVYNDKELRALCDGTVMITNEKIDPDLANHEIDFLYGWRKEQVEAGVTKLTFNVIPPKEIGRFRLKETV